MALNLDNVAINGLGFLRQRKQFRAIAGINFDLAVAKVDSNFIEDVIIVQLPETLDSSVNRRFVGSDLLLLLLQGHIVFL